MIPLLGISIENAWKQLLAAKWTRYWERQSDQQSDPAQKSGPSIIDEEIDIGKNIMKDIISVVELAKEAQENEIVEIELIEEQKLMIYKTVINFQ